MTAERARKLLTDLAATVKACHCIGGEWTIEEAADQAAKALHDEALETAAALADFELPATRMDAHHAAVRLRHANLTGAAVAMLKAIHDAGGYHVFDPGYQTSVQTAMRALENAALDALHHLPQED